eukprot:gb/GEZJ01009443.1/.p2 GENE.gb/GEZJ01009443.1/~~gb/GEZJ01009443.1/.p2  ORF type:complete len:116 (-),score=20.64 gb/GEZJ01009443.1/:69-416(-)
MSVHAGEKTPNEAQASEWHATDSSSSAFRKFVLPAKGSGAISSVGDNTCIRDESATVRVSDVIRSTEEADLEELGKGFGPIWRIFLSRDLETGERKGFTFVALLNESDAALCLRE